ncbi:MAG: dihydroneopterin aldolase [Alphaproteobacteria bacterium]|nr:dihydroneopterin aldolase [Alphaproteobacteria bacterium]
MTYYPHVLSVNRLELVARLGVTSTERLSPQKIEVSCRFYYPQTPDCARDDTSRFIDYEITTRVLRELVDSQEFRLIEYMAMQCYDALRRVVDELSGPDVKIWVQMHKISAPIANLHGGAAFTYSDLPADARIVAAM